MLWHYRLRADECASRITTAKSDVVKQNYQRLLESWNALIKSEEARLSRVASAPQSDAGAVRRERPHLQLVRVSEGIAPMSNRPVA